MLDAIHNCDCLQFMSDMEDGSVDLIVTDPPYLINYKTNHRKDKNHEFNTEIQNDSLTDKPFIEKCISQFYRILKEDTACYIFCSTKTIDFFKPTVEKEGFILRNMIAWDKGNWTAGDLEAQFGQQYEILLLLNKGRRKINGHRYGDIWKYPRVSSDKLVHQNQKPISLIKSCIEQHSNKGDVVLDAFSGSGTTALASKELDRRYIALEIEKKYCEIAEKRLISSSAQQTLL